MSSIERKHLKKLFYQNRENRVLILKFSLATSLLFQIFSFFLFLDNIIHLPIIILLFLVSIGLNIYAIFKTTYKNLAFPTLYVSTVFIAAGNSLAFFYGTGTVNSVIMIIAGITIIALVIGTKYALIVFILNIISLITISFLHETINTFSYTPVDSRSSMNITLGILMGIGVIITILWLSTRQIEYSREKAIEYAWRLEQLNQELEKKVEQRTEELVRSQQKQLNQLNQLSTLGRISSGLVHDIANHITTIQVNIDLLNEIKPKDIRPSLDRIHKSTNAISDLIEITRDQAVGKETKTTFDPVNELAIALTFLEYKAKVNRAHIFQKHVGKAKIYGNPIKFNQIVVNLVSNAIEALKGSKVRKVEISSQVSDGYYILSVKDSGKGIFETERKKIFNTFYSTKGPKRLGMGLSIIQDGLKSFKGKLELKTEEGKGSEFIVKIPLKKAPTRS